MLWLYLKLLFYVVLVFINLESPEKICILQILFWVAGARRKYYRLMITLVLDGKIHFSFWCEEGKRTLNTTFVLAKVACFL